MGKFILTDKSRKSQVWGFDLTIAVTIFLVGIIAAYIYAINFLNESQDILDDLFYEGNSIASLILSEGSPENWNLGNVEIPGILTNNKINQSKLENFYQIDYNNLKKLLNTKYEFYFNFTGMKIQGSLVEGIGSKPVIYENLVKIERFSIYENKPAKFILLIWS